MTTSSTPIKKKRAISEVSSDGENVRSFGVSEIPQWQSTIEKAVPSIVSIRFSMVSSFDTDRSDTSEATGFIVDAEKGLILTNRHVACSGPFVGEAILHDHEEVEVWPVYRDPVHDFGFLRFDPKSVRYMPVRAIPLAPSRARVGLDIRVVGNDAGEKLSILAGSISRLDRNSPDYGELTYNDFNTFYMQAASSTSGGSSGSPVLDIDGNAVALQAGGHTKAATDFFLPLDRIARALNYIQNDEVVPRGTIQTQFLYRPFDEAKRLGLKADVEAKIREMFPKDIGLLVAETVVPSGPAASSLEEGDVLIKINGSYITKFVPLAKILDDFVGEIIKVEISRGGEHLTFDITVQDLHSITPNRYVEIGGGKVNELSYQLARAYAVPVSGVYVCEPSGMLRFNGSSDQGWMIKSVNNTLTPNLDVFVEVMQQIPDRSRVPIVYYSIGDVHTVNGGILEMDKHWSPFRMATRDDSTGLWNFKDLNINKAVFVPEPMTASFPSLPEHFGPASHLINSLVTVSFYAPCRMDGFPRSRKNGSGLIVDAELGLIVVGQNNVPFTMGDVYISFADSIIIPGKVEYIHPTQNITFLSYDPKLIGNTQTKTPVFSKVPLVEGHQVSLLTYSFRPLCINTVVADIMFSPIPTNATPRFRAINFDSITLDTPLAQQCGSGLLADANGHIQGLWLTFLGERNNNGADNQYHRGIHIETIFPILSSLKKKLLPEMSILPVELGVIQISNARNMGLTKDWVHKIEESNPKRHQLFLVRRLERNTEAAKVLKELDVILSVNDQPLTRINELDIQFNQSSLKLSILREKKVLNLSVPTTPVSGEGTTRIVMWAGAVIQEPHRAVRLQSQTIHSGCYVSTYSKGSPAYMYGVVPTLWITHVNGEPITDLDSLLNLVVKIPNRTYVRVKTVSFDNIPMVVSVKVDYHYFPTCDMVRDPNEECGWKTTTYNESNGTEMAIDSS